MFSRNKSRLLSFVAATLFVFFLSGCYSFTASTLPSHIKTVKIHEVEDKTMDPVLANNIRAGVLDMFKKNAGGNAFWEAQGFTLREDLNYRNKALAEMVRIDPDYIKE